ncbi:Thioredoxin reductase [Actinacidiphila yanglinensis]|uniref:Thioredoxin reductase n=1 Tax=Actinacidiphila yanglinensis TaxID=310779 RepID=A0A1H5W8D0_9ACTN|nr:FAD-dependent oxidoreductase [Actinacidiphila yanglinensis]SEF95441.1 Thioredoxin reductase [Actinacidiphila yanglinensis]
MPHPHDVAVVGAGPAGLAAAVEAAEAGLDVALVDAAGQPGGQYWRHFDERHAAPGDARGLPGGPVFTDLRARLRALSGSGRVRYLPGRQVWLATRDDDGTFTLRTTATVSAPVSAAASVPVSAPESVTARALILCPGGYDRQLPVPGWDLPGVMAAGGVQALLKGHRTLAGKRAVVAGTGPFLLPVATGLARAGAAVAAVVEANGTLGWSRDPRGAVSAPGKGVEALRYAASMARHRIPYRTGTVIREVLGDGRVEAVRTAVLARDGRPAGPEREIAADLVALGWGFTPSLELPLMLGARTRLDLDGSLVVVVDALQRSSVEGVYVAGEATGVGGAALAVAEGRLSALALAASTGDPAGTAAIRRVRRRIRRARRFAAAMHRAYPVPAGWPRWLPDSAVVCRCEEVTYGDLRHAHADLGATDPRTLKMLARPGMGWCQGRICGFATAGIASCLSGRPSTAEDLRALSGRTPAAPVRLGELAALAEETGGGGPAEETGGSS